MVKTQKKKFQLIFEILKEKTTLLDNDFQTITDAIMMKTNMDQYRIVTHKSTKKVRLVNLLPVGSNLLMDVTELQVTYATSLGFEKTASHAYHFPSHLLFG